MELRVLPNAACRRVETVTSRKHAEIVFSDMLIYVFEYSLTYAIRHTLSIRIHITTKDRISRESRQ